MVLERKKVGKKGEKDREIESKGVIDRDREKERKEGREK